jgi:hypothetical protein
MDAGKSHFMHSGNYNFRGPSPNLRHAHSAIPPSLREVPEMFFEHCRKEKFSRVMLHFRQKCSDLSARQADTRLQDL